MNKFNDNINKYLLHEAKQIEVRDVPQHVADIFQAVSSFDKGDDRIIKKTKRGQWEIVVGDSVSSADLQKVIKLLRGKIKFNFSLTSLGPGGHSIVITVPNKV